MSDHYFSAHPTSADAPREVDVHILGEDYRVSTTSGIFSPQGIDKGTAVLLHKAPLPQLPAGSTIVDLGCGWGPLTLALASHYRDSHVTGIDVNERALELTAKNAAAAGLTNVDVAEESAASVENIDLLWSNPPIRIGKDSLHTLLIAWLTRLAPTGVAYLVVQRNLGADSLASWLSDQGFPTTKLGSQKGFRVLEVGPRRLA
ncbi:class I SAM-dependent methyltransferase [Trueperella pecoris]|uniref:Methyltransferase n=1 Tax=Trueperella pecoris TaxID=2733571 RepID=A0A7M1QWV6_9ACTO|nr:methyltransferase [Trueperella pecoris]QOR46343.1 methyltransferase [Trueperella pecoris]QTG76170.1 methyltransferase [Trueperella pecoris]